MSVAGSDAPFALYHDRTREGLWREPISSFKREYWFPSNDIVTITLHRTVDIDRYVRQSPGDEDWADGRGSWRAIIDWDSSGHSEYEINDIDLSGATFPLSLGYWASGDTAIEVGFLKLSGQDTPLFYSVLGYAGGDEDAYVRCENLACWHLYGDRFEPLGMLELDRRYGESSGYERLDLKTVCRVEDTDGDGDDELTYARQYIIAEGGLQTEFSDLGMTVFEYAIGDPPPPPSNSVGNVSGFAPNDPRYIPPPEREPTLLRPARMIFSDSLLIPLRPSLPVLIFPGESAFGGFQSSISVRGRSGYNGPPKGGGHIIALGKDYLSPFGNPGTPLLRDPTIAFRLFGDSVEFEAAVYPRLSEQSRTEMCRGEDYSFLLWIDRELLADFGDSECSNDDEVYHVRSVTGDTACTITKYAVVNARGDFSLSYSGQLTQGSYSRAHSPDREPHLFHWRLSQSECGLLPKDNEPRMCGIAIEMVCSSGFDTKTFDYKSSWLSYPLGFNRTDPRTWGTLMVAERKDTTYVDR